MPKRSVILLLEDMLESVERCLAYTQDLSFEKFCLNTQTVDAVLRCLEVLGEAANQMPEEFRSANPELPWHQMRGLRNRIVHAYFDVNLERVWITVQNNLPMLKAQLIKLLNKIL